MSRKTYEIGDVFFPGLETNDRESSGNLGRITIGGDRGDVEAATATNEIVAGEIVGVQLGVKLWDVTFLTTLELADDQVEDEVREVVRACYDSIQEETFSPQKRT